jgi:hypothetical protein
MYSTTEWKPAVALLCGVAAMTVALYIVLDLSDIPYNIYELFREGGGVFGPMLFCRALIVPGFGSRAIGWRLGRYAGPGWSCRS